MGASADSFEGLVFAGCAGFVEAAEGSGWSGSWLKFYVAAGLLSGDIPVLLDAEVGADVGFGSGSGLGAVDIMAPPKA